MTRRITLQQLVDAGACESAREEFERRFGDSVVVTQKLCASVASVFDFGWAAGRLLGKAAQAEYKRIRVAAWAEYERIRAPARAEYERIRAPARAEYERIAAAAWAEHERIRVAAWAEYERIDAPARAEYERIRARTFAKLYNREKSK